MRERVGYLAGIGMPLENIAASVDVPVEDLQFGGKLHPAVRKGESWAIEQVAAPFFEKAKTANGIQPLFWLKCRAKFRETGERESEEKPERQIEEVTFRLIKGGLEVSRELKDGLESGATNTGLHGAATPVESEIPGAPRGPRRGEELAVRRSATGEDGPEPEPQRGVSAGSPGKS